MPLRMRIVSFDTASVILNNPVDRSEFTHVISIGMPGHTASPYPCDLEAIGIPYVRLEFDDVHRVEPGAKLPLWQDINWLINCFRVTPDDSNILFHCHAGQSRSGAAALIYAFIKLKSEEEAMKKLLEVRPQARPNRLVLLLADHILGSKLLEAASKALGHNNWYLQPLVPVPGELDALGVPKK